jgi:hypothetical protein
MNSIIKIVLIHYCLHNPSNSAFRHFGVTVKGSFVPHCAIAMADFAAACLEDGFLRSPDA